MIELIKQQFASFIEVFSKSQNENYVKYYEYLIANLKQIEISPAKTILGKKYNTLRKSCKFKSCYYNATKIIQEMGGDYCEGYIISPQIPIPIAHAWNFIDGHYIDLTAEKYHSQYETNIYGLILQVPLSILNNAMVQTGVYGELNPRYLNHLLFSTKQGVNEWSSL